MKYLAVILALIIGTPSIAHAGELDGKGLICKSLDAPNDPMRGKQFLFRNSKVQSYGLNPFSNLLGKSVPDITIGDEGSYSPSPSTVTWHSETFSKTSVDRKSLVLLIEEDFAGRYRRILFQCRISNKQGINAHMKNLQRSIKSSMKKNKL